MKILIKILQKHRLLALVGIRLVQITGKHPQKIHPKHLVNQKPWFIDYMDKKDTILDFGCGNGQNTLKAAKKCKKITGFDYDDTSLTSAKLECERKKIKNAKFVKHNGEKGLPFKNKEFDGVLFLDVLEHLKNRKQALAEVARVLKDRGYLLISVPNVNTSWKKLQKRYGLFYYTDPDHKTEFTKRSIESLLKKHGFRIEFEKLGPWDTPMSGFFDLIGGISLPIYKRLRKFRNDYVLDHPQEADGFDIVATKIS